MQISRHWRLNSQRYRLEGYRYSDGTLSLQARPAILIEEGYDKPAETKNERKELAVPVA
jgi:hypothetical protein